MFSGILKVGEKGIERLGGGRSMGASQLAVGANARFGLAKPETAARFEV
jgi:hypothetical protein